MGSWRVSISLQQMILVIPLQPIVALAPRYYLGDMDLFPAMCKYDAIIPDSQPIERLPALCTFEFLHVSSPFR